MTSETLQTQIQQDNVLYGLAKDNNLVQSKYAIFNFHGQEYIYCKESIYIFTSQHNFRKICVWLTQSAIFRIFTSLIILSMIIQMAMYDYSVTSQNKDFYINNLFNSLRFYYLGFYSFQAFLNIIAKGIYQQPGSYMRSPDGFCNVLVIILSLSVNSELSIFFVLRIIFLMQMLSYLKIFDFGWKLVNLYTSAFFQICAILFLLFFFITIFAILGSNLWSHSMDSRCRLTAQPISDGEWPINELFTKLCIDDRSCP